MRIMLDTNILVSTIVYDSSYLKAFIDRVKNDY